jgi:hypothetical protein
VAAEYIDRLIADLDADAFKIRERASQELEELEEIAGPALERTLAGKPSPEVRRRLNELLRKLSPPVLSPEHLRTIRAVAVLEDTNTPQARELLRALSESAPAARLTQEAKASLERLAKRPASKP